MKSRSRKRRPTREAGQSEKLWGGRFTRGADPRAERFTGSLAFDRRLWPHDITGSVAWAKALAKAGLLSAAERDAIVRGLQVVRAELELVRGEGKKAERVPGAFFEAAPREGIVIGVIPASVEPLDALERRDATSVDYDVPDGYPNPWVELAIYTHLPDSGHQGTLRSSRNHLNVLSADAIVALPGEAGTESEMWLAVQYGVPIAAYGAHRTVPPGIVHARTLSEMRAFLTAHLSRSANE